MPPPKKKSHFWHQNTKSFDTTEKKVLVSKNILFMLFFIFPQPVVQADGKDEPEKLPSVKPEVPQEKEEVKEAPSAEETPTEVPDDKVPTL